MKIKLLIFTFSIFLFFQNEFLFAQDSKVTKNSEIIQSADITQNEQNQNSIIIKIEKSRLPEIEKLYYKDSLYQQYSKLLENYYLENSSKNFLSSSNSSKKNNLQPVEFFLYEPKKGDTIFSIAARCNIPYDTIISINKIENADENLVGKKILLPVASGIFVLAPNQFLNFSKNSLTENQNQNQNAKTSIETFIQKKNIEKLNNFNFYCYNIEERYFFYFPELRLDKTTRAFF